MEEYVSVGDIVECPGEDSNLHTFQHQNLNLACLPISPPGQTMEIAIVMILDYRVKHYKIVRDIRATFKIY